LPPLAYGFAPVLRAPTATATATTATTATAPTSTSIKKRTRTTTSITTKTTVISSLSRSDDERDDVEDTANDAIARALAKVVLSELKEELKKSNEELKKSNEELKKKIKEINEEIRKEIKEEIKKEIATFSYKQQSSIAYTNAVLGRIEINRWEKAGLIIDVPIQEDKEAFWSESQQQIADTFTEPEFTTFVTPFFNEVLAEFNMIFVNSENVAWLSQGTLAGESTRLKPDGFATHRGMYRTKSEKLLDGFRFGVPEKKLFDCFILFESRLTANDDAFGQVVRYLHHFCPEASANAVLFDRTAFYLFRSHKGVICKVEKAKWAENGSKSFFRDFIAANKSPWITRLTEACKKLAVDVVEGQAFLGCGARGRVFKVKRGGETFALKIVDDNSIGSLFDEARALTEAQITGLTVEPMGKCICIGLKDGAGAALLLTPVGEPLSQPQNREDVANLYELLWKLHEKGVIHGDPRVPNVIRHGGKLLWIDLSNDSLRSFDAETLTRSILRYPSEFELEDALTQLIMEYGNSSTLQNICRLSTKVCECLGLPTSEASG